MMTTLPRPLRLALCATATLLTSACEIRSVKDMPANDRDTMTVRQRDSVLGQSVIPGARGVTQAMTAADSITARNARQTVPPDSQP